VRELRDDGAVLERDGDDQRRFATFDQLQNALAVGQLEPRIGLSGGYQYLSLRIGEVTAGASDKARKRLIHLLDWLHELDKRALNRLNPNCSIHQQIVKSIKTEVFSNFPEVSIWTLYRAQKKVVNAGGRQIALLPKFRLRGRQTHEFVNPQTGEISTCSKPRLDPVVGDFLIDLLAAHHADKKSKIYPKTISDELKKKLDAENARRSASDQLRQPARVTIARWIGKTIPAKELSKHRVGAQETTELFRSNGVRVTADRILQFLQFDDIDSRMFLVDEETGLVWGTPKFTFALDEYSRYVTGVDYGPEARNSETAVSTVIQATRRKNMNDPVLEMCQQQWVGCGKPGIAILDNASYNTSETFKLAMVDMGIDFAYSKPKEPANKSAVEHFNRLFKREFVATLAGSCVDKNKRGRIDAAMKGATLTLDQFQKKSMKWIVDDYAHQRQEDGLAPIERWNAQVKDVDLRTPRLDRAEFAEFTLPTTLGFRNSGGLERNDLRYQSDRLDRLRDAVGYRAKVKLRVNPNNLEQVFVCDSRAEEWFTVPCAEDPAYVSGLTERQHQLVRSFAAKQKKQSAFPVAKLLLARDDLRDESLKDRTSKRYKVRQHAFLVNYAFRGSKAQAVPSRAANPVPLLPNGAASHGLPTPMPAPPPPPKPTRLAFLTTMYDSVKD